MTNVHPGAGDAQRLVVRVLRLEAELVLKRPPVALALLRQALLERA